MSPQSSILEYWMKPTQIRSKHIQCIPKGSQFGVDFTVNSKHYRIILMNFFVLNQNIWTPSLWGFSWTQFIQKWAQCLRISMKIGIRCQCEHTWLFTVRQVIGALNPVRNHAQVALQTFQSCGLLKSFGAMQN